LETGFIYFGYNQNKLQLIKMSSSRRFAPEFSLTLELVSLGTNWDLELDSDISLRLIHLLERNLELELINTSNEHLELLNYSSLELSCTPEIPELELLRNRLSDSSCISNQISL
jgi:hypothetical protein